MNPMSPNVKWPAPPDDIVPGQPDLNLQLGVTDRIGAILNRFRVWPTGIQCILSMRVGAATGRERLPMPRFLPDLINATPASTALTVEYADGATGTSTQHPGLRDRGPGDDDVILIASGTGTNGWFEITYWISPLPPPGPVAFRLLWPAIALTGFEAYVDAEPLRSAATEAIPLWSGRPGSGGMHA
jgi:hypothetical protein